ncbi:MAG TPA: hypothetical protein VGT78_00665 [Rhizomicrobium sp.]|nr:hypothetical protein [Rhizomicrobium sp.]
MSNLAYRIGVVTIAALLAGPALAEDGHSQIAQGVTAFDGGANSAYPGSDDTSVVNPDGDDDADNSDSGDSDQDDGGNSGAPDTYPA